MIQFASMKLESFVNLGLSLPEKSEVIEAQRMAVVRCGLTLDQPNSYAGFEQSVINMFAWFGISESDNPLDQFKNRQRWQREYNSWHKAYRLRRVADIEILTLKHGYANIFFVGEHVVDDTSALLVYPGPCSLSYANHIGETAPIEHYYSIFEQVIGVSPHEQRYQNQTGLMFFYVANYTYKRIPASTDYYNQPPWNCTG